MYKAYFIQVNNDRLIYLLVRKKSGELTLDEQLELSALIRSSDSHLLLAEGVDEVFASSLSYKKDIGNDAVNDALKQLHQKMRQPEEMQAPTGKYRRLKVWLAAASVALVAGLTAFYFFQAGTALPKADNIVSTKKGSKTNLVLPDGTKVWVNADSKLTYDKGFGSNTREVTLTGEAYFDVTKDPSRPFIVHTPTLDVKVLGTAFNVRAYPNEASTQTTLLRGAVEVLLKNKKHEKILLAPNEKIIVQNAIPANDGHITIPNKTKTAFELQNIAASKNNAAVVETEWTKNRLAFEQERIENLLPVLERWYNVTIELRHSAKDIRYNGTFENDSLEDVLASLKAVGGFQYRIEKDKVVIY
ncbi:MAG: FecR family protein [Niabella sp.]